MIFYTGRTGKHGDYKFEHNTGYLNCIDIQSFHKASFSIVVEKENAIEIIENKGRLKQNLHYKSEGNILYLFVNKFFSKSEKLKIEGYFAHKNGYNMSLDKKHPYRIYRP